jgi:virginiamycin B lyase
MSAVAVLAVFACATAAGATSPTPRQTAVVPTGAGPCGVTAGRDGQLWVGVYGAGKVLSIDPRRGHVNASVRGLRWACRVAVGRAAVWVTRDRADELVRISRGSGRIRHVTVGSIPFDVLLAHGSVWATSAGISTIAQLDGATGGLTRVYRDGIFPSGLAWCAGRVWVGHGADLTWLTAIQPSTHRITRVDVGTRSPRWPRCVRGALWVTTDRAVLRVDPRAGDVLARIEVGGTPVEATAGPDGLVWVSDKERSRVFRIDPATNEIVDSFSAGPGAYAMARVDDSVWITSFAGHDIRRFDR